MVSNYDFKDPCGQGDPCSTKSGSLVYVVDKDSMLGNVIEGFLSQNGFRPKFFTDSATALQTLTSDREKPVLLLANLLMNQVNGMELIESSKRVAPKLKTLLFDRDAGKDSHGESRENYSFKPDGFVSDPLFLEILITTVRSILEDRQN